MSNMYINVENPILKMALFFHKYEIMQIVDATNEGNIVLALISLKQYTMSRLIVAYGKYTTMLRILEGKFLFLKTK